MNGRHLSILLADDDQDDHYLFSHAIREFDPQITIQTVWDGVELLHFLKDSATLLPDIIFLDLNMPLKNGIDSLKEIRETENLADLPVVICSTADSENNLDETFRLGANLYLQKPYSLTQLVKAMKGILGYLDQGKFPSFPRDRFFYKEV